MFPSLISPERVDTLSGSKLIQDHGGPTRRFEACHMLLSVRRHEFLFSKHIGIVLKLLKPSLFKIRRWILNSNSFQKFWPALILQLYWTISYEPHFVLICTDFRIFKTWFSQSFKRPICVQEFFPFKNVWTCSEISWHCFIEFLCEERQFSGDATLVLSTVSTYSS